ncbi:MAG: hypothetical protein GX607_02005 [Myxococcales bacterium]|jgi:hypothetical protein|nr:hypothetical protein [Myxococcales bacterium]
MRSARSSSPVFARSRPRRLGAALLALGALTSAHDLLADTPAENKAAARNLALQGVQLAEQGSCEEAIPLFMRAEALFHAPTILASLGECQVRLGRLVEGTETLRRVVREKLPPDAPDAFFDAQRRARALLEEHEPRIAQLTIDVEPAGVGPRLHIDGSPVSAAFIGAPRPTDPGAHLVEVFAEGHQATRAEIHLAEGARETLRLTLSPLPNSTPPPSDLPERSAPSTQRFLGYVSVGLGGALLTAGAITGVLALGKEKDLQQRCPGGRCPPGERETLDEAHTLATTASFATIGGAAFGLTGLVLLLTAAAEDPEASGAQPSHAGGATAPPVGRVVPWLGWGAAGVTGTF